MRLPSRHDLHCLAAAAHAWRTPAFGARVFRALVVGRALVVVRALVIVLAPVVGCAVAAGCAADSDDGPRVGRHSLIDHTRWEPVAFAADPWRDELPAAGLAEAPTCTADALETDAGMLEIRTAICNFVTVRTTLQDEIRVGERLRLVFWHLALVSDPPSEGVVELKIAGKRWWRQEIDIPSKEQIYKPNALSDRALPVGTEVMLHVHNHGLNSWRMLDLTTGD